MDRRSFIKKAGVTGAGAAGATALAAPAIAQEMPKITWRLTSSFPKSLDTIYGAAETMANHVKAATGGNFEIQVFAAGEIVGGLEAKNAAAEGTVEMAHTASYYYWGQDPTYALGTAIPFGLNARQTNAWFYQGGGNDLMNEFYATQNIYGMPCGNTGAQMGGWYRKEIKSMADLKGLKMRLGGGLVGEVMAKMGAVPQSIPAGEIYQSLEKGTLDAAEWVGPYDDEKLGFNKVAPYYYYPGWWEGGPEVSFYVNTKAQAALSAENKAILEAACAYAAEDMLSKYDALNPIALKKLVANKTKLLPFPKDVMEGSFKASMEVFAANDAKSPEWKKIYADMKNFQRDQLLWFRFCEAGFDNFMYTRKI